MDRATAFLLAASGFLLAGLSVLLVVARVPHSWMLLVLGILAASVGIIYMENKE